MGNGSSGEIGPDGKRKPKKNDGNGFFFWRKKKKVLPEPKEPFRSIVEIMRSTAAKERIVSAIKLTPPGTPNRWDQVLNIVNRRTMPSEEDPEPLNIETNFNDLKVMMRTFFDEVKFISSDGLALARNFIPKIYDKHTIERARQVSQKERDERFLMDECFAYGEVDTEIFATMFLKIISVYGQKEGGIFYDLGCGVGTLVFVAAFIGNFKRVIGVEYLTSLISRGEKRMVRWDKFKGEFPNKIKDIDIQWTEDDFVENPFWTGNADFIFLHWTAFSWESRKLITKYLRRCPEGTHVITFTSPIQDKNFELFLTDTCDTSWGKAEFFFHEKISPPQGDSND